MEFKFSSQSSQMGRVPGGGLGCLLLILLLGVAFYYALKGIYFVLWWATPALLVLTLIINWRVFPNTIKNWLDTLEEKPLQAILMAAIAGIAFPFFSLWLLLKALGQKKLEKLKREFEYQQQPQGEFVDFEELDSRQMGKAPDPEPIVPPKAPIAEAPKQEKNPYDDFFGDGSKIKPGK